MFIWPAKKLVWVQGRFQKHYIYFTRGPHKLPKFILTDKAFYHQIDKYCSYKTSTLS